MPGIQTVPRAEAWAVKCVMELLAGEHPSILLHLPLEDLASVLDLEAARVASLGLAWLPVTPRGFPCPQLMNVSLCLFLLQHDFSPCDFITLSSYSISISN